MNWKSLGAVGVLLCVTYALLLYRDMEPRITNALNEPRGRSSQSADKRAGTAGWKTYVDARTGFSINYPATYALDTSSEPPDLTWGSRALLTIHRPDDLAHSEFHMPAVSVVLQRQPVAADGIIYHNVAEFTRSGAAAQIVNGASNAEGDLLAVNSRQAVLFDLPPGDANDTHQHEYFFIDNDLIYEIGVDADDPYANEMISTMGWK
jgi:hypothetical protein